MDTSDDQCHLRIEFAGHPPLDYRADRRVAEQFVQSARTSGLDVTLDDYLDDTIRPLPCASLWGPDLLPRQSG